MTGDVQHQGAAERRCRMRALIEERAFARVAELSQEFGVSAVTVRGDLDALEAEDGIRRIRGGAKPFDAARPRPASRPQPSICSSPA